MYRAPQYNDNFEIVSICLASTLILTRQITSMPEFSDVVGRDSISIDPFIPFL
jgi:hypothetical protein